MDPPRKVWLSAVFRIRNVLNPRIRTYLLILVWSRIWDLLFEVRIR